MSGARRSVHPPCPEAPTGAGGRLADPNPFEAASLGVARGFFQSFAHPPSQGWMGASAAARAAFPEPVAPGAVLAVLGVLQALRGARRSTFRFANPGCPCCAAVLTERERGLMASLRALREGRPDAARAHALLLLEGQDPTLVLGPMAVRLRVAGVDEPVPVGRAAPRGPKVEAFDADWYLVAADMSALPLAAATLEAMPRDARGVALLEVTSEADA